MNEHPVQTGPLLRAQGLSKTYPDGNVHALQGVSLEVESDESVAIIGPSGCGKSTLAASAGRTRSAHRRRDLLPRHAPVSDRP